MQFVFVLKEVMLSLHPVTVQSLDVLKAKLPSDGNGDCNLSMASLITRAKEHEVEYACLVGKLVLRWRPAAKSPMCWIWPANCDLCPTLMKELEDQNLAMGEPLRIYGTLPSLEESFRATWSERRYTLTTSEDWGDYLYSREALVKLEGRKLAGKRNFVKRYRAQHPDTQLLPLNAETIPLAREFLKNWYAEHQPLEPMMQAEADAIEIAFAHFEALGLRGGILVDQGVVHGFTYGMPVTDKMFAVHIEKADRTVTGAYPALASFFTASLPEKYEIINREEDLGIPGLRKAKEDWNPMGRLEKGYITVEPLDGTLARA